MMIRIKSGALIGLNATDIDIEIDASQGLPGETIVGLPDKVIKESKNRIKTAIKNSGFKYPLKSYTINLAPAELPKEGAVFDLPIATGILQATNQLPLIPNSLMLGELSLDGTVKPIRSFLSLGVFAKKSRATSIFIPTAHEIEADLIYDPRFIFIEHLAELRSYKKRKRISLSQKKRWIPPTFNHDISDVKGQLIGKRALEIAIAGHHNLLVVGPPGSGKTMLLKRLTSILPEPNEHELIDILRIKTMVDTTFDLKKLVLQRPFRTPHHTISYVGLAGGGSYPTPGEITLAHNGVLFLDEFPEYQRQSIEVLRQPLESHTITISRAHFKSTFPAQFILVATMNPCPCGYFADRHISCSCKPHDISRYWRKISGPILDRIDIIIDFPRLPSKDLFQSNSNAINNYTSEKMKARINNVRKIQTNRQGLLFNGLLEGHALEKVCKLTDTGKSLLAEATDRYHFSGRSFNKLLKVARTIADMENKISIQDDHLIEAIQFRSHVYEKYST